MRTCSKVLQLFGHNIHSCLLLLSGHLSEPDWSQSVYHSSEFLSCSYSSGSVSFSMGSSVASVNLPRHHSPQFPGDRRLSLIAAGDDEGGSVDNFPGRELWEQECGEVGGGDLVVFVQCVVFVQGHFDCSPSVLLCDQDVSCEIGYNEVECETIVIPNSTH